jgi:hypothetical protein
MEKADQVMHHCQLPVLLIARSWLTTRHLGHEVKLVSTELRQEDGRGLSPNSAR